MQKTPRAGLKALTRNIVRGSYHSTLHSLEPSINLKGHWKTSKSVDKTTPSCDHEKVASFLELLLSLQRNSFKNVVFKKKMEKMEQVSGYGKIIGLKIPFSIRAEHLPQLSKDPGH